VSRSTTDRFDGDDIAERIDELVNPSRARRRREKRRVNPRDRGCCCDAEDHLLDPLDAAKLHEWLLSRSVPEELAQAHPIAIARWLEPEITRWFNLHPPTPPEGPPRVFVEGPEASEQQETLHAERVATAASPDALFVFHPLTGRLETIGAAPEAVSSPASYEELEGLKQLPRRR